MRLNRRTLMVGSGCATLGALLPLRNLFGRSPESANPGAWGRLRSDPRGMLDLPTGFSYSVVDRADRRMSDGYRVPGAFDGMGCFAGPRDTLILMRNHENAWLPFGSPYGDGPAPPEAYDRAAAGCVTRLVVHRQTLEVEASNLVLTGTVRNCAGGLSPWGWLSCEETTEPEHGFVFLCSVDASQVEPPRRIVGYGRFRHEAACVDPSDHVAFLTEDQPDGCLYRFVPDQFDRPFQGRLQALRIPARPGLDTGSSLQVGDAFDVDWVDIEEPNPRTDTVRAQAHAKHAAVIRRGEGIWLAGDVVCFSATTGGPAHSGQIFSLQRGRAGRPDRLSLMAQSTNPAVLDMPDNLTIAPSGDVVIAEDALGGDQFVRFVGRDGRVSDFARNALSSTEIAGLCFSPDGGTLFLNLYGDGLTLAVRGPFAAT